MRKTITAALACASITSGLVIGATSAGADPNPNDTFELTCGSTTYDVSTGNGNGEFTPAFDTESNRVFHPTAFGDFTGTVYDVEGNVVDEFTEEGDVVKGSSGKKKDVVECEYLFDDISDGSDPEFPEGYRFVGGGDVTGYWTPAE